MEMPAELAWDDKLSVEEVKEEPDSDLDMDDGTIISLPVADRVVESDNVERKKEDGGSGKMEVQLNLKALEGDPRDTAVGAAAVGVMADAVSIDINRPGPRRLLQVKAKGPEETQVQALTGFGQEIMGRVSVLRSCHHPGTLFFRTHR